LGKKPGFFDRRKIALETKQYANARVAIAHSRLMRDELIGLYGVDPAKIHLLYPPVNAARFSPPEEGDRERLRAEFGFGPDRAVFLFPSGGHVRKGLPFLREFFASTDLPVELVVAGRGVTAGRNVRGLGYVRDIERLYRAADATVLASSYEPFGLVGVESALCGTPVVLPENTGCCEVLDKPLLHTFRLGDAGDFRRAVGEIMDRGRRDMPSDPRTTLRYDCGVRQHVEALIACLPASGSV
jgi:glycosyltransferase involved in cell wall biosynthesis